MKKVRDKAAKSSGKKKLTNEDIEKSMGLRPVDSSSEDEKQRKNK